MLAFIITILILGSLFVSRKLLGKMKKPTKFTTAYHVLLKTLLNPQRHLLPTPAAAEVSLCSQVFEKMNLEDCHFYEFKLQK